MSHDNNKKQGTSNGDCDTLEKGVVHCTGIVAIVSTRSRESVVRSDDDDELLPSPRSTSITKRDC